ncbi:hypothetical protein GCM10023195_12130 [Actinoallomurus liliacearum]|uniref:Restriction endonuclease n=1 Tax=Actinoallomurus liliacearum TaxID=1080073 RepID=A0ABP8TF24_9ACTN
MANTQLDQLLEEIKDIESRASRIQGEQRLELSDAEIDSLISDYQSWYARALDVLPAEFEERFRGEYEGGFFSPKIKSFLQAPGDINPLFNGHDMNPLVQYWSKPFSTTFRGPLLNQRQILLEGKQKIQGPRSQSADLLIIERICRNFSEFLAPLTERSRGRTPLPMEDEYDVQDVLQGLLRIFFDDVRPEDYVPEQAGSRSRVDFLLKLEKIVVEAKMARVGLGYKEVAEQLIVDIERYKAHPDCGALVALVYDPDRRIRNRRALEHDLSRKHDGLPVYVYVVQ